jgi:hypothetical protein
MSFVFFAALVDPGGRPGPFLRFSGGPVGGLAARRFLTWVHCCSSSRAGAGAAARDGAGAAVGVRVEIGVGAEPRVGGTGSGLVFRYMLALQLLYALLAVDNL